MSRVEDALQAVVEAFATAFAGRIRGCYVEGSYADGSEVTCSDVDMVVVFKDGFVGDKERRQAEAVGQRCLAESAVELDLVIEDEYGLRRGAWPTLKLGSVLLYGEDIRDGLQLIPLVEWTRDRMHSSLWRTAHLCGRSSVMMPLDYPDPQGEFYGYDQRKMRLAGGEEVQGTRDLIRLVSWSATAILGYRAGQYVARKSDCHTLYRRYIADEWAGLLEDIYALCRGRWHYLIPKEPEERRLLRQICERTLGFENHFLRIYKTFLLAELRSEDAQGRLQALTPLRYVFFDDREVVEAVRALRGDAVQEVRDAVQMVRRAYL